MARDGFDALTQVQLEVLDRRRSARGKLEEMVKQYVLFAMAHQTHYELMFKTLPAEVGGAEGEALRDAALASFSRLVEAVRTANPALSSDEAGRKAMLAWALAHGAVDVGRWGAALTPGFTAAALASDVGHAVGQLVRG